MEGKLPGETAASLARLRKKMLAIVLSLQRIHAFFWIAAYGSACSEAADEIPRNEP